MTAAVGRGGARWEAQIGLESAVEGSVSWENGIFDAVQSDGLHVRFTSTVVLLEHEKEEGRAREVVEVVPKDQLTTETVG